MPQLNIVWWLFNFLLSWASLTIALIILLNTNINNNTTNTNTTTNQTPNNSWTWN